MISLIESYFKNRPKFSDIACHFLVRYQKEWPGIWGSVAFSFKSWLYGVKCAGKVRCYGTVYLIRSPGSEIAFGTGVSIVSNTYRSTAASIYSPTKLQTFSNSAKILIGDNVGMNGPSIVARSRTVKIGSGTMLAPNVVIMDSDFHAIWPPEDRAHNPAFEKDCDVTIGKNVWIGANSLILKGVTIGANSIIGAGSIVTGSIPANVIAAGNPARVIKSIGTEDSNFVATIGQ